MNYVVTHQGREVVLSVEVDGDGRYRIRHEGRLLVADLRRAGGDSLYTLLLGQEAFEVAVVPRKEQVSVGIRGHELGLVVESEQARNARLALGPKVAAGPHTVKSVMPGRVVRVLVREGEEVSAGTPLLILEAMKMENEIRSLTDGRVARILVTEGQTVVNGDALVSIL